MNAKLKVSLASFLTLAFIGVAALLFVPETKVVPVFSLLLIIVFAAQVSGNGAMAFILTGCATLLGVYGMGRVPEGGILFIVILILVLWGGSFIIHLHDQRLYRRRHSRVTERDEILKESRVLKQELSFYEAKKDEMDRRAEQRRQLSTAARELGSLLNPLDIQNKLVQIAQTLFPGHRVGVSYGQTPDPVDAYVIQKRQPLLVPNEFISGQPLLAAPISAQRAVAGILRVDGTSAAYSREDLRLLDILAGLASLALDNSFLFQQAQDTALRDHLTGLLTHRAFQEKMDAEILEASRYAQPLSVILCDIDHFKSVNDAFGHQAGDRVLQGFAHVLDRNVRDIDTVARTGGEEFAILLLNTTHNESLAVAEKIRLDVESQEFDIGQENVSIRGSFGVATFPEDATSAQQLLRQADQRLYRAKAGGRNQVRGRS